MYFKYLYRTIKRYLIKVYYKPMQICFDNYIENYNVKQKLLSFDKITIELVFFFIQLLIRLYLITNVSMRIRFILFDYSYLNTGQNIFSVAVIKLLYNSILIVYALNYGKPNIMIGKNPA